MNNTKMSAILYGISDAIWIFLLILELAEKEKNITRIVLYAVCTLLFALNVILALRKAKRE